MNGEYLLPKVPSVPKRWRQQYEPPPITHSRAYDVGMLMGSLTIAKWWGFSFQYQDRETLEVKNSVRLFRTRKNADKERRKHIKAGKVIRILFPLHDGSPKKLLPVEWKPVRKRRKT